MMESLAQLVMSYQTYYARNIILRALGGVKWGRLTVIYEGDDGKKRTLDFGVAEYGTAMVTVTVKNNHLWWNLCSNMDLGMSEGYMMGDVEIDDLVALFMIYIRNRETLGMGSPLLQFIPRLHHTLFYQSNTIPAALRNSVSHYDTSNDLFAGFLSTDLNYSSPIWATPPTEGETLESAQLRKVRNIIQKANIVSSDHILDIGCGWGNLAMEAVRMTGCRVTGVLLSKPQKELAEARIREAGMSDRIEIVLCDYRNTPEVAGGYNKVVSVEILEHIGAEHMQTFFATVTRLLKPGVGRMVVQGITVTNQRHDTTDNAIDTFIDRYIFPGGYLPSTRVLLKSIHEGSNGALEIRNVQSIGPHYIKALRMWREKFLKNWDSIIKPSLIGDRKGDFTSNSDTDLEHVKRKWLYYFCSCEAGFRTGMLGDCVITAEFSSNRTLFDGIPL